MMRFVALVIGRHPALVNARHPATGVSLVQFVVEACNQQPVLDKLLQVDCHIGLQPDGYGRTALHIALEQGKYALLRVMLRALLRRRFTVVPSTMGYVSGCFATLAAKYPRDFLHLISHMPLQEEPGHGRTGTARPLAVQRLATTAAASS